jgi:hypothetical protein
MISLRYLKFVLVAFAAGAVLVGYMVLTGTSFGIGPMLAAFIFGMIFPSAVVVRLPIFRDYYRRDRLNEPCDGGTGIADHKAALILNSICSGGIFAVLRWLISGRELVSASLCAALVGGIMSLFHEWRHG